MDQDYSGEDPTRAPPIGQVNPSYNLNNERLDCERIEDMTTVYDFIDRPSFVTVLLRFFGNMFVDVFRAIFD
ncbi:uncharacterized protein [Drosophila kikkawai]|uniref:Uncharacterized protein n=1 Tax=Drosophila kikkawai TaxID=30033 RepID=A0A6P4I4L7_DROKI|nr:uncharacterized protein LOC108072258 [Drosophila kikkawai]